MGPNVLMVTYSHVFVSQNLLSPALSQRLRSALRSIDEGMEEANLEKVNQALSALVGLHAEALREMDDAPAPDIHSTPVRPE
jgi:hypothetical protein